VSGEGRLDQRVPEHLPDPLRGDILFDEPLDGCRQTVRERPGLATLADRSHPFALLGEVPQFEVRRERTRKHLLFLAVEPCERLPERRPGFPLLLPGVDRLLSDPLDALERRRRRLRREHVT